MVVIDYAPASCKYTWKTYYKRKRAAEKQPASWWEYEVVSVPQYESFDQAIFEARVATSEGGAVSGASKMYSRDEAINHRAITYVRDGGSTTVLGK